MVHIYSEHAIGNSVVDASGRELDALILLAQIERDGRLEFRVSGPIDLRSGFPRLATDTKANGQCFYSEDWYRPLMDGLLPGECGVHGGDDIRTVTVDADRARQGGLPTGSPKR